MHEGLGRPSKAIGNFLSAIQSRPLMKSIMEDTVAFLQDLQEALLPNHGQAHTSTLALSKTNYLSQHIYTNTSLIARTAIIQTSFATRHSTKLVMNLNVAAMVS